jgi:hypothetical protein
MAAVAYAALILLLLGRNWFRGFAASRAGPDAAAKSD